MRIDVFVHQEEQLKPGEQSIRHLLYQVLRNQDIIIQKEKAMSQAVDNANAALDKLASDVAALVARPNGVSEAEVQALADKATAIDATIPQP